MGMSIENSIRLLEDYLEWQKLHKLDGTGIDEATRNLIDVARKYQLMQADYETRLKADMVAMLEYLKKEMNPIKECEYQIYGKEHWNFVGKCQDVIQQKIDAMKEDK